MTTLKSLLKYTNVYFGQNLTNERAAFRCINRMQLQELCYAKAPEQFIAISFSLFLPLSLHSLHSSWVKDFVSTPNHGHVALIDLIKDLTDSPYSVPRKNPRRYTVLERDPVRKLFDFSTNSSVELYISLFPQGYLYIALLCLKALMSHRVCQQLCTHMYTLDIKCTTTLQMHTHVHNMLNIASAFHTYTHDPFTVHVAKFTHVYILLYSFIDFQCLQYKPGRLHCKAIKLRAWEFIHIPVQPPSLHAARVQCSVQL